ncbi:hypothetical protein Droror1_Dr00027077 [Drosera rotundifolia]
MSHRLGIQPEASCGSTDTDSGSLPSHSRLNKELIYSRHCLYRRKADSAFQFLGCQLWLLQICLFQNASLSILGSRSWYLPVAFILSVYSVLFHLRVFSWPLDTTTALNILQVSQYIEHHTNCEMITASAKAQL